MQVPFLPAHAPSEGEGSLPVMIVDIFVSNLVLSAFVMLTLSGFAFFLLSPAILLYRGWLWGVLLNGVPTSGFPLVLPVMILEGEGYVLAALAGVNLGLSWLKPEWVYRGKYMSRREAVKMSLKNCLYIYGLVSLFLLVAAIVEVVSLSLVI
ncbi:hypothetical protein DRO54_02625 [Candidatus Bathyarchaeota archaeon]|nr:MAG: hypothetical protein DRO54_02625 [Candidatus Bathyarchaeota archaeon]